MSSTALSHVSIGTNNFLKAVAFYDRVLSVLGIGRILEFPGAVAYGKSTPEFWVQTPFDGKRAHSANGIHFAFHAPSKESVEQFYNEALKAGATSDGAPGPRPMYGPAYFGAFVYDQDGHKIEAMYFDPSQK